MNVIQIDVIYTSQQKKRNKDFFLIYFYVKTKTIAYYHLGQCLREARLSSQNKQYHPFPLRKISGNSIFRPMIEFAMIELSILITCGH